MDAAGSTANLLLAACFLASAIDKSLRREAARNEVAGILHATRWLPTGPRFVGLVLWSTIAVQGIGATLLATGLSASLGAGLLLAFLLPATLLTHRFWLAPTGRRTDVLNHFLGNMAIAGGLMLAIVHSGAS